MRVRAFWSIIEAHRVYSTRIRIKTQKGCPMCSLIDSHRVYSTRIRIKTDRFLLVWSVS